MPGLYSLTTAYGAKPYASRLDIAGEDRICSAGYRESTRMDANGTGSLTLAGGTTSPSKSSHKRAARRAAELSQRTKLGGGEDKPDHYFWGTQWPPLNGAGNFADDSFKVFQSVFRDWDVLPNRTIKGYRDGYATTAPVGSFPANRYGLYDLAGNVWEWCEDWYNVDQEGRVLRGGSWATANQPYLLDSFRYKFRPAYRADYLGFRVVLSGVKNGL